MTAQELHNKAANAVANGHKTIMLRLLFEANGERVRLLKRSGPYGRVLAVEHGYTIAEFSASNVLSYLKRTDLVEP